MYLDVKYINIFYADVGRPYTPVSPMLMDQNPGLHSARAREKKEMEDMPPTVLYFMIKIYPNGKFTQILDKLPLDDGKETPTLQVSTPHGFFDLNFIHDFTALFLISGGSGNILSLDNDNLIINNANYHTHLNNFNF